MSYTHTHTHTSPPISTHMQYTHTHTHTHHDTSLYTHPAHTHTHTHTHTMTHSQQSSLTVHFSISSVGRVQTEPSSGNCLTYRSRERMPIPQVALHGDQLI